MHYGEFADEMEWNEILIFLEIYYVNIMFILYTLHVCGVHWTTVRYCLCFSLTDDVLCFCRCKGGSLCQFSSGTEWRHIQRVNDPSEACCWHQWGDQRGSDWGKVTCNGVGSRVTMSWSQVHYTLLDIATVIYMYVLTELGRAVSLLVFYCRPLFLVVVQFMSHNSITLCLRKNAPSSEQCDAWFLSLLVMQIRTNIK